MLKATQELEANYNLIKEFLLDTMKFTPNLQALATWLFLTGCRISEATNEYYVEHECTIENGKQKCRPKKGGKETYFMFILPDMQIVEVAEGSGLWMLYVPRVAKRKSHSKVKKDEIQGRWVPTEDEELLNIIFDYLEFQRPTYRGEILSNTYYNPSIRYAFLVAELLYNHFGDQLDPITKTIIEKSYLNNYTLHMYNRFRNSPLVKWAVRETFKGVPIMDLAVFPMNKNRYDNEIDRYGYYMEGRLYDIQTGKFIEGQRRVYSHFFREARVNTLYYEYEYTLEEIRAVIGWRDPGSIEYYLRAYEKNISAAVNKMMAKAREKAQSELTEEEKNELKIKALEGKLMPTKKLEDILYAPVDKGHFLQKNIHSGKAEDDSKKQSLKISAKLSSFLKEVTEDPEKALGVVAVEKK